MDFLARSIAALFLSINAEYTAVEKVKAELRWSGKILASYETI